MNSSQQIIVNASAHEIPLPDGMIHTVATSPPYYSLRKYAGEQFVEWPAVTYAPMPGLPPIQVEPMRCALGLEPTPEAYIGHLVLCFREVKRVLRDDGCCWIVMGDSQQGDLMLIPHRLALALQADGWIVRNDVVWAKVAPMPESVSGWRWERCRVKEHQATHPALVRHGDRSNHGNPSHGADIRDHPDRTTWADCPGCPKCESTGGYVLRRGSWRHTRAHETVLMLAKGMGYYADQERVREAASEGTDLGLLRGRNAGGDSSDLVSCHAQSIKDRQLAGVDSRTGNPSGKRNPRSVLTPRPELYSGSHYAVYPRTLIAPLLRATAPTRVCPVCGAAWAPIIERTGNMIQQHWAPGTQKKIDIAQGRHGDNSVFNTGFLAEKDVRGYRPTCTHDADPVPGWALDPFAGTFTTGAVCAELGVNCVGLDISAVYLDDLAKPRIGLTPSNALDALPLFAELETKP